MPDDPKIGLTADEIVNLNRKLAEKRQWGFDEVTRLLEQSDAQGGAAVSVDRESLLLILSGFKAGIAEQKPKYPGTNPDTGDHSDNKPQYGGDGSDGADYGVHGNRPDHKD